MIKNIPFILGLLLACNAITAMDPIQVPQEEISMSNEQTIPNSAETLYQWNNKQNTEIDDFKEMIGLCFIDHNPNLLNKIFKQNVSHVKTKQEKIKILKMLYFFAYKFNELYTQEQLIGPYVRGFYKFLEKKRLLDCTKKLITETLKAFKEELRNREVNQTNIALENMIFTIKTSMENFPLTCYNTPYNNQIKQLLDTIANTSDSRTMLNKNLEELTKKPIGEMRIGCANIRTKLNQHTEFFKRYAAACQARTIDYDN